MSVIAQKRRLPPKIAKMQARKKQKMDDPAEVEALEEKAAATAQNVKIDDLTWMEVDVPDTMDDYEGFFGLEEIDGVDVVKSDGGTKVSYQLVNSTSRDSKSKIKSLEGSRSKVEQEDPNDQEWDGFEDDLEHEPPTKKKVARDLPGKQKAKVEVGSKELSAKSQKKDNKGSKKRKTDAGDVGDSAFGILDDMEDDEGDADISAWSSLQLSSEVTTGLSKLGFSRPTPIQSRAIPDILSGHDLIGKAPTGSGKTLAFGIPIYEHWLSLQESQESRKQDEKNEEKNPVALIVLPTRELAHQISTHLMALCRIADGSSPNIATLTGGLSIQKQRRMLAHADIVIATPGRLWEVISEGQGVLAALQTVKFLVLDEADRLLSEGHFKELDEVLTALNREITTIDADGKVHDGDTDKPVSRPNAKSQRQTLVFSATFSQTLQQKLSKRTFHSRGSNDKNNPTASMEYLLSKLSFHPASPPQFVDVNPSVQMAPRLREGVAECPGTEKDLYLYALLLYHPAQRALVFANSISAVRRLVPFLVNLGLNALPLHSQMAQKARLRSLERFSAQVSSTATTPITNGTSNTLPRNNTTASKTPILIATDVAARGLDISNVGLVLHYHLPRSADTYVHRSGRTARANNSGSSIVLCAPEEAAGLRRLVAQVHAGSKGKKRAGGLKTLDVDPRVIAAIRPRAALSKRIADSEGAKEKGRKEDDWLRTAAEELGVDEDEAVMLFDDEGKGARGRGRARKQREKDARGMSKGEVGALKEELRELLGKRVNIGVSARYLTSNAGLDVAELLKARESSGGDGGGGVGGLFLGSVGSLGLDD